LCGSTLLSAWRRFSCSQIVDHVEDASEQVTRHRDLGYLEDTVAGVGDDLRTDLHHLLADSRLLKKSVEGPLAT
jgi:hypothetical protein